MASTFSPSLRLELIETGAQAGTWGTTTNNTLGALVESAISGYTSVSVTSANQALTALNGALDQARNAAIALTTTTGAAFNVYIPPVPKLYVIFNASAYTATVYNSTVLGNTTAAGTGVAIPAGKTLTVWTEGTNVRVQNDAVTGDLVGNVTGNLTGNVTGNVTGSVSGNAGTVTNGVYTVGNQTIAGIKTFSSTITGSVTGNAGTVTNGAKTFTSPVGIGPNWTVEQSGNDLLFKFNGANRMRLDSSGNLTVAGNVTGYATV
jgi:hypothetical protein